MARNRTSFDWDQASHKRLVRKLRDLGAVDGDFIKAMKIEGNNAVQRMERAAPVDTGRLRRNIEMEVHSKGIEIESRAVDPRTRVDYAPIQELPPGTLGIRTTPYFWRNVRQMHRKLFGRFNDIITDILRRK